MTIETQKAEWARFGVDAGWSFAIRHRVRWSECDPFRHAGHRAYFEWFEEARNRYLEAVGLAPLSPVTPTRSLLPPARCVSGTPASTWNMRCGAMGFARSDGRCSSWWSTPPVKRR